MMGLKPTAVSNTLTSIWPVVVGAYADFYIPRGGLQSKSKGAV